MLMVVGRQLRTRIPSIRARLSSQPKRKRQQKTHQRKNAVRETGDPNKFSRQYAAALPSSEVRSLGQ